MRVPTVLETQLYFHVMDLMSSVAGGKDLNIFRYTVNSGIRGMAVYLVQNVCDALVMCRSLWSLRASIYLHLWFNTAVIQIQILLPRSDGFVALKQQKTFRWSVTSAGT